MMDSISFKIGESVIDKPWKRAQAAGQVVRMCDELDSEFTGEVGGWCIVIRKLREHREMVAEDIGLEATNAD